MLSLLFLIFTKYCQVGKDAFHSHGFHQIGCVLTDVSQQGTTVVTNRDAVILGMSSARPRGLTLSQNRFEELVVRVPMYVKRRQSSRRKEEWLSPLALQGRIIRNLTVLHFPKQGHAVGQGQQELLQISCRLHVLVV